MEEQNTQSIGPGPHEKSKNSREFLSTLAIILAAPLLALALINFVFQTYEVYGPSMEDTLHNQDRVLVLKTEKTWARLTNQQYLPERYEIVVFNHQGASGFNSSQKQLIKRVIGLPGDRVVIKDGLVTVFNEEHPEGILVDQEGPQANTVGFTEGNIDVTVKPGEVFVLGDNRRNSSDSRNIGPIRTSDIVGEMAFRIYPL